MPGSPWTANETPPLPLVKIYLHEPVDGARTKTNLLKMGILEGPNLVDIALYPRLRAPRPARNHLGPTGAPRRKRFGHRQYCRR